MTITWILHFDASTVRQEELTSFQYIEGFLATSKSYEKKSRISTIDPKPENERKLHDGHFREQQRDAA